ncbi:hypothetical protein [Burkholderia multivorans]|uniref:hypothetical protein n=1 Tax=Burkholderia multivorans TaxID=87883 RepID=UPI0012D9D01A|nr:hypothetical protein [Burkholderia multivorans]
MSDAFVSAFAHRTRMSAACGSVRQRSPEAPEAGECRVRAAYDGLRRAGVGVGHVESRVQAAPGEAGNEQPAAVKRRACPMHAHCRRIEH